MGRAFPAVVAALLLASCGGGQAPDAGLDAGRDVPAEASGDTPAEVPADLPPDPGVDAPSDDGTGGDLPDGDGPGTDPAADGPPPDDGDAGSDPPADVAEAPEDLPDPPPDAPDAPPDLPGADAAPDDPGTDGEPVDAGGDAPRPDADDGGPDADAPDPDGTASDDDGSPADAGIDLSAPGLCGVLRPAPWTRGPKGTGGAATFHEVNYHPAEGGGPEWIELHNPLAVDLDLSGWSLQGGVRYTFPEGTLLPARGHRVVSADPAALEARGLPGVLGPWEGALDNGGEALELRNNAQRLMDLLDYGDSDPWPVAPDGGGSTLAKADPESASAPFESWTGRTPPGGTPGAANRPPEVPEALAGLRLNEVSGAAPAPAWVEVANAGESAVEPGGARLATSGGAVLDLDPGALAPGEVRLVRLDLAGIPLPAGEKVFLLDRAGGAVLDGVEAGPAPQGRARPGDGPWLRPRESTPGRPNAFAPPPAVVLNEILYHADPVEPEGGGPQQDPEEWIEILNAGPVPVDLSGWQVVDEVAFEFPAGTTLDPGAFLVVARDAGALRALHPGVAVLGDFRGRLDDAGGRILLRDDCGNPVDQVRYADGGRWPSFADGGGATLELRDPRADNGSPEAWAAGDASGRAPWVPVSYQAVAAPSPVGPDGQWEEFVAGLLDEGVVLLDDLRVVEDPEGAALDLIRDGTFDTGVPAAWRLLGNHRHSRVVPDPDDPANPVLRLEATGPTEHMHNHAETTLAGGRAVANGTAYRVSFRARWVAGSHRLNTRLYFNRLARTTVLPAPGPRGTPGRPNTALVANLGPTFDGFGHRPVVPAPGEDVVVEARPQDPDGVATVTAFWSVDGGPATATPLAAEADGVFRARIPGQAAGARVQFWVEAADGLGESSSFPAAGPASRALWQVADGLQSTTGLHDFRILLTPADGDWLHDPVQVMSNDPVGATVVVDERTAFYDVGVRLKGSERGRSMPLRAGFAVRFHADRPFRGVHRTVLVDRSQGVDFGQREILIDQVMARAGSPSAEYGDLVQVIPHRPEHAGPALLQTARFGDLMLEAQFPDGDDGALYEYELIYYPLTTDDSTPEGLKLPQPDRVVGTPVRDLGPDPEAWRHNFLPKNNAWRDDFAPMMAFAAAFGLEGADYEAALPAVADVDQWLRAFAFATLSGAVDNYASGAQHNAVFYARPGDGRMLYFPHDLDFYGASPRSPLVASGDLARMLAVPAHRRAYYGHLLDIVQTAYNGDYLAPWAARFGALLPGQDFAAYLQFVVDRAAWVMDGAPDAVNVAIPAVPFQVLTNGGADFEVPGDSVTLDGTGWIDVREIRLLGRPEPLEVQWPGEAEWVADVPLDCGPNVLALVALDARGRNRGGDLITVTRAGEGCP